MILSQTPRLTLQENFDFAPGWKDFKHNKWVICPEITDEFFWLPVDVRYIKFVAHNYPSTDRVKLEFNLDSQWEWPDYKGRIHVSYEILADGEEVGFHTKAQAVVERLLRKHSKIYVECLYED